MTEIRSVRNWPRLLPVPLLLLLLMGSVEEGAAAALDALCDGIDAANVWDNDGTGTPRIVTFYYAGSRGDYHPVGVTADKRERGGQSDGICLVKDVAGDALAVPQDYVRVWWDRQSGATRDGSIWAPVCPAGYVAVGVMVQASYRKPIAEALRCVREDLTVVGTVGEEIYRDSGSRGIEDLAVWKVTAPDGFEELGAVFAAHSYSTPAEGKIRLIRRDAFGAQPNPLVQ